MRNIGFLLIKVMDKSTAKYNSFHSKVKIKNNIYLPILNQNLFPVILK